MSNVVAVASIALAAAGCGRLHFDTTDGAGMGPARVRSTLQLDRVAPGSPLLDFPLPITLDGTRADLTQLTSASLRAFVGTTELPLEIEASGPPLVAWVLVPRIESTTTTITIEYGGAPVVHAPVWNASYAGVWHLAGTSPIDSSSAARPTLAAAVAPQSGRVGPALAFTIAQQSCILVPSFASFGFPQVTLSGWANITAAPTSGNYYSLLTRQLQSTSDDDLYLGIDTANVPLAVVETSTGGTPSMLGPTVVTLNTWHHFAYTYDGGTVSRLFFDGGVALSTPANGVPVASDRPLFIGCGRNQPPPPADVADTDWIAGSLDELRIETVARSPDWIAYEVASDNDAVITYGPVEHL